MQQPRPRERKLRKKRNIKPETIRNEAGNMGKVEDSDNLLSKEGNRCLFKFNKKKV